MDNQKILESLDDILTFGHEPTDEQRKAVGAAIDIIEKHSKIGEWISCNEQLPEKEGNYIATYTIENSEKMCHELYFDGETWIDESLGGELALPHAVFAWQPLPAPYGVKSDD